MKGTANTIYCHHNELFNTKTTLMKTEVLKAGKIPSLRMSIKGSG